MVFLKWCTTSSITAVTGLNLIFFGLARTVAITRGLERSQIHSNCGYALLCVVFFLLSFLFNLFTNRFCLINVIVQFIPKSHKKKIIPIQ